MPSQCNPVDDYIEHGIFHNWNRDPIMIIIMKHEAFQVSRVLGIVSRSVIGIHAEKARAPCSHNHLPRSVILRKAVSGLLFIYSYQLGQVINGLNLS